MSNNYYVTSDNINGKEKTYIANLVSALKKAGHSATKGTVSPNGVQSYGQTSKAKGKIGIQIIGGRCGWTASDCATGVKKGYYNYDQIILCGCYEFTKNKNISKSAMNTKMSRPHDAGSSLQSMYVGKTPTEFNNQYGQYCKFVLADTWDEMVEGVTGSSTTSSNTSESSCSTFADSIKDLIKVWDGDIECKIIDNKCYINKITEPTPTLYAKEGVNIISNSLSLADYSPNTINKLTTYYGDKTIVITDDYLINRFGEKASDVTATELITTYTQTTSDSEEEDTDDAETKMSAKITEQSITNRTDALSYAKREWNKIRRDNGHTLELKVFGYNDFKQGEWIKVEIPSFNENISMVITKVAHNCSASDEWLTSLTLSDYYPSLSVDDRTVSTDEDSDDDEVDSDE